MRARTVAAAVVAVHCGLLLGGLAALIAWKIGEKPIDTSLVKPTLVVPQTATVTDHDVQAEGPAPSEEGWSGALPAPNHYTYQWAPVDAWPGALDTIRERLGEAGWELGDRVGDDARKVFWAARDGHLLRVLGGMDRGTPTVILQLHRTEPPGVLPAAIGGFLLGGAGTWFAARWILRRQGLPGWARIMGGAAVVVAGILSTLTVLDFATIDWWTTYDLLLPVRVFTGFPKVGIGTLLVLGGYAAFAIRGGIAPLAQADSVPAP
jgi:hypothetical protein